MWKFCIQRVMASVEREAESERGICGDRVVGVIVGVKLVTSDNRRLFTGDRSAPENGGNVDDVNDDERIGLVVTPLSVKLDELRDVMVTQIPSLPQQFAFLTANRCPVADNQESLIELRSIADSEPAVLIRKIFDKEPFAIRTTNGIAIGFIFADPNSTAAQLRALIDSTGIFPGPMSEVLIAGDNSPPRYQFAYRDEFPVTTGQESILTARDLSRSGIINIIPVNRRSVESVSQSRPTAASDTTDAPAVRISSSHTSLVSPISRAPPNTADKSVMISYVTSEARDRAVHLRRALESMNVTVFLDVNDIGLGTNWDETLNRAIQSCHLFLALVTHSYGATEWTLLELRLAFQKHIPIIPINFLDNYPPESVAIYFSTLQHFTPAFKLPAGRGKSADYWDESFAEPTAKEIVECFNREVFNWRPSSTIAHNSGVNHRNDQLREDSGVLSLGPTVERNKARPLVVISAHPSRSYLVERIKVALSLLAIDAMSSTDICINELNLSRETPSEFESAVVVEDNRDVRLEKGKAFLESEKKADAMVVLVCKKFKKSCTSKQQAFYCCLRERVLSVLYDTSESPPHWFSMFKRSMTRGAKDTDEVLAQKITDTVRAMLSTTNGVETSVETGIDSNACDDSIVSVIRRNIVDVSDENAILVYFRGSDRDSTPISEHLSRAIGQAFADELNVLLITDGFSVESEIVSKSFIEFRNSSSDVYHLLFNSGESEDFEVSANPAMGTVVGVNGSAHELDSAVASLFDACFLVENSQRRDRIAELFSWKEKIVALIVDDCDVGREVSAVVESISRRTRPKYKVCFENSTSDA